MTNNHYQQGVAILFAILLVSIVLTVSLTLFNITFRQLILSSLARESQFAFYASDSARNCARYYDSLTDSGGLSVSPFGHFELSAGNLVFVPPAAGQSMNCGQGIVSSPNPPEMTPRTSVAGRPYYDTSFVVTFLDVASNKTTCAKVTVTKGTDATSYSGPLPDPNPEYVMGKTKIEAFGYNNYDSDNTSGCYRISDRTVERASRMIY